MREERRGEEESVGKRVRKRVRVRERRRSKYCGLK